MDDMTKSQKAKRIAYLFFKLVGCKMVCRKLPRTDSLPKEVWDKWTKGLVPPKGSIPAKGLAPRDGIDINFEPGLTIFAPGSRIPEGFQISFAAPDRENNTAVFKLDGKSIIGNLTGFVENARGIQFGNFSVVHNVLEDVFGEWIMIDESVPETVKSTLSAVSDALDDGNITHEELELILDIVRGQKDGN